MKSLLSILTSLVLFHVQAQDSLALTQSFIQENALTPAMLQLIQFEIGGADSTKLVPKVSFNPEVVDGKLTLKTNPILIIAPGTTGVVIPNGIVLDKVTKKVKEIRVSFWEEYPSFYLSFGPADDSLHTFVLLVGKDKETQDDLVYLGSKIYTLQSGGGIDNPLSFSMETGEASSKVASGRKVPKKDKKKKG